MSVIPAWYVLYRGRERRTAPPPLGPLRANIALDAEGVEHLREILTEWCGEDFTVTGTRRVFAERLLAGLSPGKREHEAGHRA